MTGSTTALKQSAEEPDTATAWVKEDGPLLDQLFTSALHHQTGGDHYKKLGDYQPWQVAHAWLSPEELKGAMKLTVMAYLAREADKGGRQDIEKAMHTLQIYLELTAEPDA